MSYVISAQQNQIPYRVSFAPIVHATNPSLVRVPMVRGNGKYTVHIDDNAIRIFTDKTLPGFIKVKLAMILASEPPTQVEFLDLPKSLLSYALYTNPQSPELDEVGWRINSTHFCIVMKYRQLFKLQGDVSGTDTGSKGQGKDQEDFD